MLFISGSLLRERWPLSIIVEGEALSDSLVRTIRVRTRDGSVRRDARKVALIEWSELVWVRL